MATLEDKILGEKADNYCSSSEDEGDDNIAESDKTQHSQMGLDQNRWAGRSTNTGPKGVLEDCRRFKQLEAERREEQEAEQLALIKKLSLTCASHSDEEKRSAAAQRPAGDDDDLYKELDEMLEDEFMKEYRQRRMMEMMDLMKSLPVFGQVIELQTGGEFLDAIDNENNNVTVLVHLYEVRAKACESMSGCLVCLAAEYVNVKFCQLQASNTKLSTKFLQCGVPALLVYRGGELISSFVQLFREFGDDFFATDVEGFLVEHGVLPDKTLIPKIIRDESSKPSLLKSSNTAAGDSDYDVD